MANIVDGYDVEGGCVLEFSRRNGGTAYYFYSGMSAGEASSDPRSGGVAISGTDAAFRRAASVGQTVEKVAEGIEEILPFLL